MSEQAGAELLTTDRGQAAYRELEAMAREILATAQRDLDKLNLRDEERVDVVMALANLEWSMERDAIETAIGVEREEVKLRADVTATGLLLEYETKNS